MMEHCDKKKTRIPMVELDCVEFAYRQSKTKYNINNIIIDCLFKRVKLDVLQDAFDM